MREIAESSRKDPRLLKTELLISHFLRYGVILCALVIGLGLFTRLAHVGTIPGSSRATIAILTSGGALASDPPAHDLPTLVRGIADHSADLTMAAGLLLLIALPIVRVGMTVFLFLFEADWAFFGITVFVFAVLLFGIGFGHAL